MGIHFRNVFAEALLYLEVEARIERFFPTEWQRILIYLDQWAPRKQHLSQQFLKLPEICHTIPQVSGIEQPFRFFVYWHVGITEVARRV
jgi:hypothetical protein